MNSLFDCRLNRTALVALAGGVFAWASVASAQTGYMITGGMGNFDVTNRCDEPCDEFEVEIENIRPEDVVHTYHNSNYGSPTVTLNTTGGTSKTIIDYRNPQHLTAVNSIEHFGISLRSLNPSNVIRVRWMRSGRSATVNGQVPVQGGGSTAPASQPMLPTISTDSTTDAFGNMRIAMTVTNNDPNQYIWIKRRAQVTMGTVTLEALMPNDPVVTTSVQIDAAPIMLAPSQSLTTDSDLIEVEAEDNQSAVFSAEYFQDLFVNNGPFSGQQHTLGPVLGNLMTATISSPQGTCQASAPIIQEQPIGSTADQGDSVDIRVRADGNDVTLTYQWMKDGVPLTDDAVYSGTDGDELSINELHPSTEGFYSVKVTNACGTVTSDSALVFITGHNVAPVRITPCGQSDVAGANQTPGSDGVLTADDIIVYLSLFFGSSNAADIAGANQAEGPDGDFTADDIIVFLGRYFAGC